MNDTVWSDSAAVGDFDVGERVELHPATDTWMRGDKYGDVVRLGYKYVHVKLDKSGRTLALSPRNLRPL